MKVPAEAYWIGSNHPFDLQEAYINFRRDIDWPGTGSAILHITADSRYKLWINGQFLLRGPARCWPHMQQVDVLDISPHLRPGRNSLAVQVYSPGYSHFAYLHRGACGLLAWMKIDGEVSTVTDQSWRVRRDESWSGSVQRVSIYGSGIEVCDLAVSESWQTADIANANWKVPRTVAPAESNLWSGLQQRQSPILHESRIDLISPCFFRIGSFKHNTTDPHADLRECWSTSVLRVAPEVPVQVEPGQCLIWVFDLGESMIGQAALDVVGAQGGEKLLISYAEKLRGGELVLADPRTYCRMRPTDSFTLRPGHQTIEPFSLRGGRFIVFCLIPAKATWLKLSFAFIRSSYPLEKTKEAPLPDELALISAMCERTVLACLQDTFVDSVWRESSQWLGDCVPQAFALQAISRDLRPLRSAIKMAAAGAYADGVLPSVSPGEVHAYTVTDYNFSWIELLDHCFRESPSEDQLLLIKEVWPTLCQVLDHFDQIRDNNGLIGSEHGRRLFLDWSPVDRREPNLTYNVRYLHALELAADLATRCGRTENGKQWLDQAAALRKAIVAAFSTRRSWWENTYGTPASQLGLALCILTRCIGHCEADDAVQRIIARSLDLDDDHSEGKLVLASPFMHHYVFLALESVGRYQDILSIIRARWGRWALAGEPTTWENWNIDFPDGSACHAFSAHPLAWIKRCREASELG